MASPDSSPVPGSHHIAITSDPGPTGLHFRAKGWELRDTINIIGVGVGWHAMLWRVPLEPGLTIAENVIKHGEGALNIEACRVGTSKNVPASPSKNGSSLFFGETDHPGTGSGFDPNGGRWPPNVILLHGSECNDQGACEPRCPVLTLGEARSYFPCLWSLGEAVEWLGRLIRGCSAQAPNQAAQAGLPSPRW